MLHSSPHSSFFFFNDPATTEISPLSLHDALPISAGPTATVTEPATGATVSGSTPVSASASDNVGVVAVQFLLDVTNLDTEDTAAPYSRLDRNSTRQNSSHHQTPDPDFCLNTNTSA